jgi:hypothetical protein
MPLHVLHHTALLLALLAAVARAAAPPLPTVRSYDTTFGPDPRVAARANVVNAIMSNQLQLAEDMWHQEIRVISQHGLSPGGFACDAWYRP